MRRFWQSVVIILLVLYGLLMLYVVLRPFLRLPLILFLLPFTALTLFGFSVGHAFLSLGTRRTLLFVGLTFGISLLFESVGVLTGSVYGSYHYTDRFGLKIFGLVPLIVPIGWFMMIYPCHVLVEQVTNNPRRLRVAQMAWLAGLSAWAMTSWDLVMDPIMVRTAHWIWEVEGAYFGIPIQNFAGWLVTTFSIYFLYYLLTRQGQPRAERPGSRYFGILPVMAYVITWLGHVMLALELGMPGVAVAGFFSMGGFALIALGRLLF